jgi:hypothetical protein
LKLYDISLRGLLRWRLAAAVLAVAVSVFFVDRACGLFISLTYGWSLEFEDTWPHLLENELNAAGMRVEIANLARAGTSALEMKDIASRSIPLLKPDLVIISALQGGALTTLQTGSAPTKVESDRRM